MEGGTRGNHVTCPAATLEEWWEWSGDKKKHTRWSYYNEDRSGRRAMRCEMDMETKCKGGGSKK